MNPIARVRTMDKRLRVVAISTALLVLPEIGHYISLGDIQRTGRLGDLALFFMFAAIFIVPTSLILTAAVLVSVRRKLRRHSAITMLSVLNVVLAADIVWFFFTA